MIQHGTIIEKPIGKDKVKFEVKCGTVLESRSQERSSVKTLNSRRGVAINTSHVDTTAMWVRWDNGQEEELRPVANSVTAREGHRICSIDVHGTKAIARDEIRANLTTGKTSYCSQPKYNVEILFKKKTSLGLPLIFEVDPKFWTGA